MKHDGAEKSSVSASAHLMTHDWVLGHQSENAKERKKEKILGTQQLNRLLKENSSTSCTLKSISKELLEGKKTHRTTADHALSFHETHVLS